LIRANNAELANIPTDMGALGGLSGLAATPRLAFSKVVCKLDYLRNEGLPPRWSKLNAVLTQTCSALRIAGLHKFLHYRMWFQRELANYVDGVLNDSRARHSPLWNSRFVRNVAGVHAIGHTNYMREIDAVITTEAIERLFFEPWHSDQEAKETHSMMKVS
jgi:asparagine synthase (glutamine-hydrolysing)